MQIKKKKKKKETRNKENMKKVWGYDKMCTDIGQY